MKRSGILRSWLVLVLALFVAAGSVEAMQDRGPEPGEAALAAYVLAGGSIADLCMPGGQAAHERPCPFCHALPEAPVLAAPSGWCGAELAGAGPVFATVLDLPRSGFNPRAPPRAPPASS